MTEEIQCKTQKALSKAVFACHNVGAEYAPKDMHRLRRIDQYLHTVSEDIAVSIETHIQQWLDIIKA